MPVQPTCDNQLISPDTDKFHLEAESKISSREESLPFKFCESEGETQDREIDQNTDLPKTCSTVCPRPESCDAPRALMSVAPNLCCDETKNREHTLT